MSEYFICPSIATGTAETGTYTNPWKMNNIPWGSVQPGDTLYLLPSFDGNTKFTESLVIESGGAVDNKIIIGTPDDVSSSAMFDGQGLTACIKTTNVEYVKIHRVEVYNAAENIFLTDSKNIDISNSDSHDAVNRGCFGSHTVEGQYVENVTIEDCTFYNNGDWGNSAAADININDAMSLAVRGCLLYGNGVDRGVDGITFDGVAGAGHLIEQNVSRDHEENEVDLKNSVIRGSEGASVVRDNDLSGSSLFPCVEIHVGSSDVVVVNNRIHGSVGGVLVGGDASACSNIDVLGNVIINHDRKGFSVGGTLCSDIRLIGNFIGWCGSGDTGNDIGFSCNAENAVIKNNIFYKNAWGRTGYQQQGQIVVRPGLVVSHNAYVLPDDHVSTRVLLVTDDNVSTYHSFASLVDNTPYAQYSMDNAGLISTDGKLQLTSPCVDVGAEITGVNDGGEVDMFGHPVTNLPNIGADQGIGASPAKGMGTSAHDCFRGATDGVELWTAGDFTPDSNYDSVLGGIGTFSAGVYRFEFDVVGASVGLHIRVGANYGDYVTYDVGHHSVEFISDGSIPTALNIQCNIVWAGSSVVNISVQKVIPAQGSLFLEWTPGFGASDLPSGVDTYLPIIEINDSSRSPIFAKQSSAGSTLVQSRASGVYTTASISGGMQANQTYTIGVRWGELDPTGQPGVQLFQAYVDGTWGTAAAFTGWELGDFLRLAYGNEELQWIKSLRIYNAAGELVGGKVFQAI